MLHVTEGKGIDESLYVMSVSVDVCMSGPVSSCDHVSPRPVK